MKPEWVTAVPSLRRPELVQGFTERLSEAVGLPYAAVLSVVRETEEQATLENSRKQWLNVRGAFKADRSECPPGAALLVDDLRRRVWCPDARPTDKSTTRNPRIHHS